MILNGFSDTREVNLGDEVANRPGVGIIGETGGREELFWDGVPGVVWEAPETVCRKVIAGLDFSWPGNSGDGEACGNATGAPFGTVFQGEALCEGASSCASVICLACCCFNFLRSFCDGLLDDATAVLVGRLGMLTRDCDVSAMIYLRSDFGATY